MLSREHWVTVRQQRQLARAVAVLALGLTLLRPVSAAPASLCPDHPIRFAHYEFGMAYSSGYGGIDDDLQKELMRRSGCAFEVSLQPRARTWVDLKSGSIDMAGSGIQTAERDAFAWFFPYIIEDNVMVLGPRVPRSMQSFKAFLADPQLTLGGVRSYRYSANYDAFVDQLILARRHSEAADPGALFRMFEARRFDAFITNPLLYMYYVRVKGLPDPQPGLRASIRSMPS
ncbi:transporter substrate-binding domain-containing protein [Roseateles sp.]|uniref:substrate-binding periplasmic protein n=1 Tax=Roseateles sp. TaxID=1971397 RepID=UPI00286BEC01|nr:transporter substrate-binding domain-containing protein [Roseateles sp.]